MQKRSSSNREAKIKTLEYSLSGFAHSDNRMVTLKVEVYAVGSTWFMAKICNAAGADLAQTEMRRSVKAVQRDAKTKAVNLFKTM